MKDIFSTPASKKHHIKNDNHQNGKHLAIVVFFDVQLFVDF